MLFDTLLQMVVLETVDKRGGGNGPMMAVDLEHFKFYSFTSFSSCSSSSAPSIAINIIEAFPSCDLFFFFRFLFCFVLFVHV